MSLTILPCVKCGGEGIIYKSRYGGNDPDVWRVGKCEACEGSGNQICDECHETEATCEYTYAGNKTKYHLCKACFDAWTAEDNEP